MKKLFIAMITMASAMSVNAQVDQGKLFLGGSLGVSSTSYQANDNVKTSSFNLIPNVGYLVTDKLAVGLGIGVASSKLKDVDDGDIQTRTNTNIIIAPFVKYFVPTSGEKLFFTPQASFGIGLGNVKTETDFGNTTVTNKSKSQSLNFAISPGLTYFPSDHWSLDFRIKGLYLDQNDPNTDNDNDKTTTVGLDIDSFSPSIGISYFF